MLMTSISLSGVFGDFEITATAAEPQTTISTAQELSDIRNNLSGNYILSDNIDLASFGSWSPIGTEEEPFTGTLDGNGYVISNITIEYSIPTNIGFFGHVKNSTIKNLGIEKADYNVNIGDYDERIFSNVGGFAGVIESSTVDCCYFTGSINHTVGNYVFCRTAGIACSAPNSTITNCYVNANIYGKAPACNTMVAGCVSWLDNTTIDKCYVAGSVVAENNGYAYAGGFNASSNSSSIWGIIISYGGTVKNSVSLLSELNATGSTTYVNAIGNWVNSSNNKTISPSSADAKSQTTYDSLGWDFGLVWFINDSLPKLVSLPKTIDTDGDGIPDKEDPQWYRSSKSFYLAMMQFAQTDFGKQILSDFTPKGSYFFGVKGNGKYSKYDLELQEIDITEPEKKTAYWRDINAQTQLLETDQGKSRFVVIFDVDRSTNELTKTIAHELAGHLYNYESVLKLYEDTKDFQKANFEFFKKGSKQEHLEMENKKYEKVNLYQQVMNQIEQFFKHK